MESATATLANGSLFEERYEILKELGSGSFGRVYEARQLSTGQSVAIKLLSAREGSESSTGNEAERFRRETEICASLSHINIVQLIDSGETKAGQLYAVFAHVPGETLAKTLENEGDKTNKAPFRRPIRPQVSNPTGAGGLTHDGHPRSDAPTG